MYTISYSLLIFAHISSEGPGGRWGQGMGVSCSSFQTEPKSSCGKNVAIYLQIVGFVDLWALLPEVKRRILYLNS